MTRWLFTLAVAVMPLTQAAPVPQPARDPRMATATGTGIIHGRITAADTGAPIRRAQVTLLGGPRQRSTVTDDDGRYRFSELPAGTYTLNASGGNYRATYQTMAYGSSAPWGLLGGARPRPLTLKDGQVIDNVDVALPRAGVITGRVTDGAGEPVARVQVQTLGVRPGGEPMQMGSQSTDDRGEFRIFGLAAGEYLIAVDARAGGGGPETDGERIGFARTYAPGTTNLADAQRIRVRAGSEASIEVRMFETAVFSIKGTVMNSAGEPLRNASVSLAREDAMPNFGAGIGPDGTFTIRGVAPGHYELTATVFSGPSEGPGRPPSNREMGLLPIDVGMADLENVVIVTTPGETFTGEIVFAETPPDPIPRVQLSVQPATRRTMGFPATVEVTGTSFKVKGVFSPSLIRGGVVTGVTGGRGVPPAPSPPSTSRPAWTLKAVLLGGRDVTDVPTAFTSAHSGRVEVVFTSMAPTIEATVLDDSGKPTQEATVIAFGVDEETWTPNSSRIRASMAARPDGTFSLRGLREGTYYVAALPSTYQFTSAAPDRALFEQLKKVATQVLLNPGDTRTVELRLQRPE